MASSITLEKFVKVILLCAIAIVGGFVIYQIITNRPPAYISFNLLNEDGQLSNYPNNVTVGGNLSLRYYIGNNDRSISNFSVRVYLVNATNNVSSTQGVYNATLLNFYNHTIPFNGTYTSEKQNFTINEEGFNFRLCFELWVLNETRWHYLEYSVRYIWFNSTDS
ncbi:MAG: hypothetical protein RBG13Loki_3416 [Promethearchaeota archaeon CR_4]|nr:MAG: hypothetical protein RBG13Loki_3416 [Candidatus Lokiarchaeota archaeon CR_4]